MKHKRFARSNEHSRGILCQSCHVDSALRPRVRIGFPGLRFTLTSVGVSGAGERREERIARLESAVTDASAALAQLKPQAPLIDEITRAITKALGAGHKLLIRGNGGSACQAQHFAAELVSRYRAVRPGLPALALAADGALMSCLGNDFSFEDIFARQVQALGQPGDVLVALSTSGNSENVPRALTFARRSGMLSVALLGKDGGRTKGAAGLELIVAHPDTARVQEAHQFLIHAIMDGVEETLAPQNRV